MAGVKRKLHSYTDVHALHKELDEVSCPVCMDHPHNAVLLLCSSHDKGCRSYICDTSYRHSNCLDRFKKLHSESSSNAPNETPQLNLTSRTSNGSQNEVNTDDSQSLRRRLDQEQSRKTNLKCPLCRGTVLGLKVKDEVRNYLDLKIRTCSQESCSFTGNYHELRHHARRVHPKTRPSDIDPSRERAWNRLENQMEFGDIVSAIHSTTPGALVVGDYVIENENSLMENGNGGGFNEWWASFAMFQMIGSFENGSSSGRESRGLRSLSWRRNRWRDGNSSSNQRRRRRFWGRPRSRGDHTQ